MDTNKDAFCLRSYLAAALIAEAVFVLMVAVTAVITLIFFKNSDHLLTLLQKLMEGLTDKVDAATSWGMTWNIFVNNLLISLTPLVIFSLQLLRGKHIRIFAAGLAALVGIFLYTVNCLAAGLSIGALSIMLNVDYGVLLTVTMMHGAFELYAFAAGCMFPLYFWLQVKKARTKTGNFLSLFPPAQKLAVKLIPLLILILAVAAIIEVFVSTPIAGQLIG